MKADADSKRAEVNAAWSLQLEKALRGFQESVKCKHDRSVDCHDGIAR